FVGEFLPVAGVGGDQAGVPGEVVHGLARGGQLGERRLVRRSAGGGVVGPAGRRDRRVGRPLHAGGGGGHPPGLLRPLAGPAGGPGGGPGPPGGPPAPRAPPGRPPPPAPPRPRRPAPGPARPTPPPAPCSGGGTSPIGRPRPAAPPAPARRPGSAARPPRRRWRTRSVCCGPSPMPSSRSSPARRGTAGLASWHRSAGLQTPWRRPR